MDPRLLAMLAGGLMSGFSPAPQLPPEVARYMHMLAQMARGDLRYSRGIPGSAPQEQAALAQASGILGQNVAGQRDQMAAALGNPETSGDFQNAPDALARFGSNATGQYSALLGQLMNYFMQQRAQARDRAYSGFQAAGGLATTPRIQTGVDLAGPLGQAAYAWGMQQGLKGGGTQAAAPAVPAAGRQPTYLRDQTIMGPAPGGSTFFPGQSVLGPAPAGSAFFPNQGIGGTLQPDQFQQRLLGSNRLFG